MAEKKVLLLVFFFMPFSGGMYETFYNYYQNKEVEILSKTPKDLGHKHANTLSG
ncbi:MAG: hypothetical protein R2788_04590 [Saprospiraceae bacterium]